MTTQEPTRKWIIAELMPEGWVRHEAEFETEQAAREWIAAQPSPERFEARELEDGVAEPEA